jgi:glycosyltransferase involved in cell wall biosynthesis
MRVAYVLPDPGIPVGGVKGASVHVAEVCSALARAGADVRLLAMRTSGPAPDDVEVDTFDCPPLPKGPASDAPRRAAIQAFFGWAADELADFEPDLLYERLSLFAADGGTLATRLGAPRVVEVDAPVAAERARHVGLALTMAAGADERSSLAGAVALAVSEPIARWSLDRGAAAARVVPNGVDTGRFDPDRNGAAAAALRVELGLEGAEVVGFVGSMKPWHGVPTLLDAVALLAPARPNLRTLIVGHGPALESLRDRAADAGLANRCRFVGPVPRAAVPGYVAAADVIAAPYLDPDTGDGFYFSPLKVVEAMAAARPVVASDFEPIERMLGGTGRLVPAGDATRLAGAIDELLRDPAGARAAGQAARARAIAQFDWDGVAATILGHAGASAAAIAGGTHDGRGW